MTLKTCLRVWRDAAPKLVFNLKNIDVAVSLNSAKELPELASPIVIGAKFKDADFQIILEEKFVEEMFLLASSQISFAQMNKQDAGIVLEHLFSEVLQNVEEVLGGNISLLEVSALTSQIKTEGFGFSVKLGDNVFDGIFECHDDDIFESIIKFLLPFQVPGEKNCLSLSDVVIGPIEISKDELSDIRTGDMVSIGQKIGQDLKGYVVRQSGTFWSVDLEPSLATINSSPKKISELLVESDDKNLVGIKIGTVEISANDILNIKEGDKLKISRLSNNAAYLIFNDEVIAVGNLQHVSEIICLAVNKIGTADADR